MRPQGRRGTSARLDDYWLVPSQASAATPGGPQGLPSSRHLLRLFLARRDLLRRTVEFDQREKHESTKFRAAAGKQRHEEDHGRSTPWRRCQFAGNEIPGLLGIEVKTVARRPLLREQWAQLPPQFNTTRVGRIIPATVLGIVVGKGNLSQIRERQHVGKRLAVGTLDSVLRTHIGQHTCSVRNACKRHFFGGLAFHKVQAPERDTLGRCARLRVCHSGDEENQQQRNASPCECVRLVPASTSCVRHECHMHWPIPECD